jgi:hypothetical protein
MSNSYLKTVETKSLCISYEVANSFSNSRIEYVKKDIENELKTRNKMAFDSWKLAPIEYKNKPSKYFL